VLDVGATWTFVARCAGREVWRSSSLARQDLEARGWRLRIPPDAPAGVKSARRLLKPNAADPSQPATSP
jgi:hypothetical protein